MFRTSIRNSTYIVKFIADILSQFHKVEVLEQVLLVHSPLLLATLRLLSATCDLLNHRHLPGGVIISGMDIVAQVPGDEVAYSQLWRGFGVDFYLGM